MIKIAAANSGVEVSRIGFWFKCLVLVRTGVLHQTFGGFLPRTTESAKQDGSRALMEDRKLTTDREWCVVCLLGV